MRRCRKGQAPSRFRCPAQKLDRILESLSRLRNPFVLLLLAASGILAALRNSNGAAAATRAARMRSSRPPSVLTLDSAHREDREGERGHRDHPRTPSDPAPPRGCGQGAGSGMQRRLSGAPSRAELRGRLRGCAGRGWGGAGRRGGDDAQPATTARTGEASEVEHAAHQRRPGPGARGDGGAGAGLECLRVRVGRWAAVAGSLPAPAGMWGEDGILCAPQSSCRFASGMVARIVAFRSSAARFKSSELQRT